MSHLQSLKADSESKVGQKSPHRAVSSLSYVLPSGLCERVQSVFACTLGFGQVLRSHCMPTSRSPELSDRWCLNIRHCGVQAPVQFTLRHRAPDALRLCQPQDLAARREQQKEGDE